VDIILELFGQVGHLYFFVASEEGSACFKVLIGKPFFAMFSWHVFRGFSKIFHLKRQLRSTCSSLHSDHLLFCLLDHPGFSHLSTASELAVLEKNVV
jgi:hypothetical protein